jgi:DNA-binding transcriptional ArsR family regulator
MVTEVELQGEVVFRALADPTRRRILGLLRRGPHTVGELAGNFNASRPAISKHLRLLKRAGLVIAHPRGTASVCQLNARPLRAVNDWLLDYRVFWRGTLRELKKHVEEER